MALGNNLKRLLNLRLLLASWPWLLVITAFALLRLSKGALLLDLYAQLARPFWPGSAQREWLQKAQRLEDQQRLALLEAQLSNQQFDLSLRQQQGPWVTAAVISRNMQGWWQDLLLGAGALQGIRPGAAVTAPGGLLGRISSVTPSTARVLLLTDPSSRVAVERCFGYCLGRWWRVHWRVLWLESPLVCCLMPCKAATSLRCQCLLY
ncbi:MAG: rod shape-determining protein MreC [Synechococcaceae bacterium WBA_3_309]|nr:rod shape-determining protein MreC [Synechococcaceae bacterium WBA_3_309]